MTDPAPSLDRRTVLEALAGAGAMSIAGCSALESESDDPTTTMDGETARELAVQYAPTLYFDTYEKWFPTDPRSYEVERDGETVVDGFEAFDGYTRRFKEAETPPDPTVFFNVVQYEESPLAVVQYWQYGAFDQFTTNFHWHDWEVLHVFVDTETDTPQLYVASSHSRKIPNNEFLDPDREMVPRVLSELGSHSSALSVNDVPDRFQRFPIGETFADITNSAIEGIEDIEEIPVAYGLPRDEGSALPYLVPELDGEPIYEHERLPSVERSDLVDESLTIRSLDALTSPPEELPERSTGLVFEHVDRGREDADVEYELVPSIELEHIEAFTGPQLSFEFDVPQFAEDAVAGHITTTGLPWEQPRYDNPAADITEPNHRVALADRYDAIGEAAPVHTLVARVTEAVSDEEAPDGEGVTTEQSSTEAFALVESDPEAVPTFSGYVVAQDIPEGEHRFTVNGAGLTPHSEAVSVSGEAGTTMAGVDGEIPLVARENATKLEIDAEGTDADLTGVAVEDDFGGRLYDAPVSGRDAVYVHRGGAYTTEVRDSDGALGAFRVNPGEESSVRIDRPRTGKASLAMFLANISEETAEELSELDDDDDIGGGSVNAIGGLAQALSSVGDAARRAAEQAESGNRGAADRNIDSVISLLEQVETRLEGARGSLPDDIARAVELRLEQARRRSEQAKAEEKL
ncbi:hypothetical protein GJ631_11040 [Natronomonas sp. CBA1123]|uniref:hypothetical protein n=1 Tax=Natronomonas sp. CBA1123 TaxID=2668070 RepID=UPI0012EA5AE8|nr:hypothetical protein [Natronomonas sp. CBA1123]MUV87089.1 hypothetical protein [Natronomonas sp. CBA1123]